MAKRIKSESSRLRSDSLVDRLREMIVSEGWKPGQVLPPLRTLAKDFDVSHETVRRAVQELEREGLVKTLRSFGTVVRGPEEAKEGRAGWSSLGSVFSPVHAAPNAVEVASCEYLPKAKDTWEALAAGFRARHPETDIQLKKHDSALSGDSGVAADVIHDAAYRIDELGGRGLLLNLHPLLERDAGLRHGWVADLGRRIEAGPCWGVPVTFDLGATFINPQLVPPQVVEDLRRQEGFEAVMEWARDFQRDNGEIQPVAWPRPHILLAFFGVDAADGDGLEQAFERLPEAMERVLRWQRAGLGYSADSLTGDPREESYGAFTEGRLGLAFLHTFMIPYALHDAAFPWEVAPLPLAEGIPPRRVTTASAIPKTAAAPDLAWEFVRFLAGSEAENIFAAGNTNIPALRSALRSEAFRRRVRGMAEFIEPAERSRELVHQGTGAFTSALLVLWDTEIGACLLGEQSLSETIDRLRSRCDTLLRSYCIPGR